MSGDGLVPFLLRLQPVQAPGARASVCHRPGSSQTVETKAATHKKKQMLAQQLKGFQLRGTINYKHVSKHCEKQTTKQLLLIFL